MQETIGSFNISAATHTPSSPSFVAASGDSNSKHRTNARIEIGLLWVPDKTNAMPRYSSFENKNYQPTSPACNSDLSLEMFLESPLSPDSSTKISNAAKDTDIAPTKRQSLKQLFQMMVSRNKKKSS
ncbi:hypothetical protein CEXT_345961 [Caerostris extrusa]|uniref:Uncharacterized protein n=1 Tax=Caerostris extrusa TaxID=172846 RepID=A0AAV4M8P6_CAEEX|nr:hypothetical protein CEXT_345961 [Caerostris extrusa]